MSLFAASVILFLISPSVYAAGVIHAKGTLNIVNAILNPDGHARSAVTAGGSTIGPLITAQKGDMFEINVVDDLNDTSMLTQTSIHWHGLFQKKTAYEDGPTFVTQCPILSGNSYTYRFSSTDQAGSFWYHSHHSTQYCDGLRGPLVIYDPGDPYAIQYDQDDESTIWTLTDWYHEVAPNILIGVPDSNLFNGLGRFLDGPQSPLSVVTVDRNRRYRIRLFNLACDPSYTFSIDGHDMIIIEADGVATQPLTVDSLEIYAAQRYSFILFANKRADNYWIRFNPSVGTQGFAGGLNSAILRYRGAPAVDPTTPITTPRRPLLQSRLQPLHLKPVPGKPTPGGADVNINLDIAFSIDPFGFTVNGAQWISPNVPVLLQLLSGAQTPDTLLPAGSIYRLPPNKSVEVSIPAGAAGGPHPFHLHGHTFHVVRSANSSTYNYNDPVERDTVSIGLPGDNVTIRFQTDNAGPWFLHCHIEWHLELGLAITFAERAEEWKEEIVPDADWNELCPLYNAEMDRLMSS